MRAISVSTLFLLAAACIPALAQDGSTAPSIMVRNEPEYSGEAARARVQSAVTLSIIVGEDGKARDIHVSQGAGFGLDEKAIEAVKTWIFKPATKAGVAVPYPANIELNFSMLAKDPEDHSGQRARLNFTLPEGAGRPELIVGKLPGNPAAPGDQSLKFHLQIDSQGTPKNVTVVSSTNPLWEKQVQRVMQTWRFRPALLNGNPVAVDGVFEMDHSGDAEEQAVVVQQRPDDDEGAGPGVRHVAAPLPITGLQPRVNHTATLLRNGTVLLAGGAAHASELPPGSVDFHELTSAQIFDWATRKIVNASELKYGRSEHTATLLRDGTVLLAGGQSTHPLASAEIYDPSTGKFAETGSLHEARSKHTASLLADGRVLICGGMGVGAKYLASAEIYDPHTRMFSSAGNMTSARISFRAVSLKDGRVLLLGGASAEVYDPIAKAFHAVSAMSTARYGFSATLLANGQVLVAGGSSDSNGTNTLAGTELFDPATNAFHAGPSMQSPREYHDGLLLANGSVLLSGGLSAFPGAPLAATEVFDPTSGSFKPGPTLSGRHVGHTATLLENGNVFLAGSGLIGNGSSAELLLMIGAGQ